MRPHGLPWATRAVQGPCPWPPPSGAGLHAGGHARPAPRRPAGRFWFTERDRPSPSVIQRASVSTHHSARIARHATPNTLHPTKSPRPVRRGLFWLITCRQRGVRYRPGSARVFLSSRCLFFFATRGLGRRRRRPGGLGHRRGLLRHGLRHRPGHRSGRLHRRLGRHHAAWGEAALLPASPAGQASQAAPTRAPAGAGRAVGHSAGRHGRCRRLDMRLLRHGTPCAWTVPAHFPPSGRSWGVRQRDRRGGLGRHRHHRRRGYARRGHCRPSRLWRLRQMAPSRRSRPSPRRSSPAWRAGQAPRRQAVPRAPVGGWASPPATSRWDGPDGPSARAGPGPAAALASQAWRHPSPSKASHRHGARRAALRYGFGTRRQAPLAFPAMDLHARRMHGGRADHPAGMSPTSARTTTPNRDPGGAGTKTPSPPIGRTCG